MHPSRLKYTPWKAGPWVLASFHIENWKCGRAVYGSSLENCRGLIAHREFDSHRFRQIKTRPSYRRFLVTRLH